MTLPNILFPSGLITGLMFVNSRISLTGDPITSSAPSLDM